MTLDQFEVIAKLIRSREPVKTAAKFVLVDGMSNIDAATEMELSAQSVSNTVSRFRAAHEEIRRAYKAKMA